MHPPPSPARANFTLMTKCTPESSGCNSVYLCIRCQSVSVTIHTGNQLYSYTNAAADEGMYSKSANWMFINNDDVELEFL